MPTIEARLKNLLDETRLAMLGTQLLMGLQYNAAFSQRFGSLPLLSRWLDGVALLLILAATALLFAIPAYHQIAEEGHATADMFARASASLKAALIPLSLAIGMDVAIAYHVVAGAWPAALAGTAFVLAALLLWFALPMWRGTRRHREDIMVDLQQSLGTRIEQVLTELRIVLPGAQALFGFQFAAVLTASFAGLSGTLKGVHMISLGLVAAAVVMLIAPAAFHRIAAGGNAEEGVLRYAVRLMLTAQGFLAAGLIGDAYVTTRLVFESQILATSVLVLALATFVTLLYLLPLAARSIRSATGSERGDKSPGQSASRRSGNGS